MEQAAEGSSEDAKPDHDDLVDPEELVRRDARLEVRLEDVVRDHRGDTDHLRRNCRGAAHEHQQQHRRRPSLA